MVGPALAYQLPKMPITPRCPPLPPRCSLLPPPSSHHPQQSKSDELALEILSKAYPGRKVVGVHSRDVLLNAGNVHWCVGAGMGGGVGGGVGAARHCPVLDRA